MIGGSPRGFNELFAVYEKTDSTTCISGDDSTHISKKMRERRARKKYVPVKEKDLNEI